LHIGRIAILERGAERVHNDVDRLLPVGGEEFGHSGGYLLAPGRELEVFESIECHLREAVDVKLLVHRADRGRGSMDHLGPKYVLQRFGH
jgi:hypothetical protein